MSNTFTYTLDEIPLVVNDGLEAAFVNGEAEIEYSRDGEWMILGITLDANSTMIDGKRKWIQTAAPPVIAAIIDERLNKEWFDRVQEAVREQLASDREDALEQRAEMRRDARMGL